MDRYQTALRSEIIAHGERLVNLQEEISSLIVRREALEHALAVYEDTKSVRRVEQNNPVGPVGSQTAFILNAIRESGDRGLSTGEIYEKAAEAGPNHPTPHHSLRALPQEEGWSLGALARWALQIPTIASQWR